MTGLRRLAALLLALLAVPAEADPISAHGEADRARRAESEEIARILSADNLDASVLTSREVADTISAIPRGDAPDDFWAAYHAHVRAWQQFADAEERLTALEDNGVMVSDAQRVPLLDAGLAIDTTFNEVRRIAESYGVGMPSPPIASPDKGAI